MENMDHQILSEIRSAIDSIRKQLDHLEKKVEELQQKSAEEYTDDTLIELDIIDDVDIYMDDQPGESVYESQDELPEEDAAEEKNDEVVEEVIAEEPLEVTEDIDDLPEDQPEDQFEEAPEDQTEESPEDDDLPGVFDEQPTQEIRTSPARKSVAVIDAMTGRQSWRTDMPGTSVNDIRSAIALNDRLLFINYLFNEDPMAFQEAVVKINSMTNLDQVIEFVESSYPEWDLESEVVYRFMMAVRRRVK